MSSEKINKRKFEDEKKNNSVRISLYITSEKT